MVGRIDVLGCGGEQEPGDCHMDGLGEDLLSNAERRLGVELTLVEVRGLLELEERLDLPPQPVELSDRSATDVRTAQRGQVEGPAPAPAPAPVTASCAFASFTSIAAMRSRIAFPSE